MAFTTGTDGGSGIGTRLLQRASATLTGSTCGTYGAFATIAGGTNPGSSPVVDTVSTTACYKYQYAVSDNVGNTHTATSASVVKVNIPCGAQLLGNPGFESGAVTWTASAGVITNGGSVAARTGTWKALLGGNGTDTTENLSQDVYLPANCTATLTYYLRVTTSESSGPPTSSTSRSSAVEPRPSRPTRTATWARRTSCAPWTSPPTPARRSR